MQTNHPTKPPFFTLLLLISFAAVNAVLFTPALPNIATFFGIPNTLAEYTVTWFLIGYALGQLVYGPIANRFGYKPTLYVGVTLQIISSLVCVMAGLLHAFPLLILGRFTLAIGSGVGLTMAFTLVNIYYEPKIASQKIAHLMLSFAVAPGLGIALGGIVNAHFGWMSCFYVGTLYGVFLWLWLMKLPDVKSTIDKDALNLRHLWHNYAQQFKNKPLVACGLLMGCSTSFIYAFCATAPFIAINLLNMTSTAYGFASIIPAFGLLLGSLACAKLTRHYPLDLIIRAGIVITSIGVVVMSSLLASHMPATLALFLPMTLIYFGLSFILPNASSMAMQQASNKPNGSAVMSFINMGTTTFLLLNLSFFSINLALLPMVFVILCLMMMGIFFLLRRMD